MQNAVLQQPHAVLPFDLAVHLPTQYDLFPQLDEQCIRGVLHHYLQQVSLSVLTATKYE